MQSANVTTDRYKRLGVVDRQSAESLSSFIRANADVGNRATRLANRFALQSYLLAIPLALADFLALYGCLSCCQFLLAQTLGPELSPIGSHAPLFVALMVIPIANVSGLYPGLGQSMVMEFRQLFRALFATLTLSLGIGIFFYSEQLNYFVICSVLGLGALPVMIMARFGARRLTRYLPTWGVPALIFADPIRGAELFRKMKLKREQGFRPVGVVLSPDDYWQESKTLEQEGIPAFDVRQTSDIASKHGVTWAIISRSDHVISPTLDSTFAVIPNRILLSSNRLDMGLWDQLFCIGTTTGIRLGGARPSSLQIGIKRMIDLLITVMALIIGSPVLLFFCFMIKLSSRGPIFYGQKRIGKDGREFTAWKFRSMVQRADEVLQGYLDRNPEAKTEWEEKHKLSNDPRVTTIGDFLRRTSLDELPQLWNVLRGDMSLVGPRPLVDSPTYDAIYVHDYPDEFEAYKSVRPGLTGLWQVSSRSDGVYELRVFWDMYYIRNWSIWLDVYLIMRTIKTVLLREGAS